MRRCPHCSAFVPATLCPECDHRLAPPSRALARLRNAALGAGTLLTLAACYGAAYQPMPQEPAAGPTCDDPQTDLDGDGFCGDADCAEGDPDRQC